jgi:hypothetical protein
LPSNIPNTCPNGGLETLHIAFNLSPVRFAKHESVIGKSDGECTAFGRETILKLLSEGASDIGTACDAKFLAGESTYLLGFHAAFVSMGELPLGAYPRGVQMGNADSQAIMK